MPLTEDERREWERRFRDEAEQEDARRRAAASEAESQRLRSLHRAEQQREAELAQLKLEVRESVWKEKGYVRHTDSRGVQIWISPEEHNKRNARRRKRRKSPRFIEKWGERGQGALVFAGVLALAVVLGLALSAR